MVRKTDSRGKLRRLTLRWHRWLGGGAAVLILLLAVTGVLINHSHRLGLDQRHVDWRPLLEWYGMGPPQALVAYQAGEHWLLWLDGQLYFDATPVPAELGSPVGAVRIPPGVVVAAGAQGLALFTPDGMLIERIGLSNLPGTPLRLGRLGDRVLLETATGRYASDADLLQWQRASAPATWSAPQTPPQGLKQRLLSAYRGQGLPWSRVLADLHSGRILGGWGVWLMDLAALALVLLALSGLYNWLARRRR